MSVAYIISTNNRLSKTDYDYKHILKDYSPIILSETEGIKFDEDLWESEQETLGNLF